MKLRDIYTACNAAIRGAIIDVIGALVIVLCTLCPAIAEAWGECNDGD